MGPLPSSAPSPGYDWTEAPAVKRTQTKDQEPSSHAWLCHRCLVALGKVLTPSGCGLDSQDYGAQETLVGERILHPLQSPERSSCKAAPTGCCPLSPPGGSSLKCSSGQSRPGS